MAGIVGNVPPYHSEWRITLSVLKAHDMPSWVPLSGLSSSAKLTTRVPLLGKPDSATRPRNYELGVNFLDMGDCRPVS